MEGEFIEGEFLGKAKVAYPDGGYYEGPIRGNLKSHGFGIIKYPNGSKYFRHWKNGKRDGYGIYHFLKGQTQVGEWVNGELKETTQVWMKGKKVAQLLCKKAYMTLSNIGFEGFNTQRIDRNSHIPEDDNMALDVYSGGLAIEPLRISIGSLSFGKSVEGLLISCK